MFLNAAKINPPILEPLKSEDPVEQDDSFVVALVDSNSVRRNAFRQKLDKLGFASLAFDSPQELATGRNNCLDFGCLIVAIQEVEAQSPMRIAMRKCRSPLLLIAVQDDPSGFLSLGKSMLDSLKVDVIQEYCNDHELKWRLQLLRKKSTLDSSDSDFYKFGKYNFDLRRREVWIGTEKIPLKPLEFKLSLELFRNINSVLTREKLYSRIWGQSACSTKSRKLDVCICSVRKKMRLLENGFFLNSLYGRGYELQSPDS